MTFLDFFSYSDCSDRHAHPWMTRARRRRNLMWYGPRIECRYIGSRSANLKSLKTTMVGWTLFVQISAGINMISNRQYRQTFFKTKSQFGIHYSVCIIDNAYRFGALQRAIKLLKVRRICYETAVQAIAHANHVRSGCSMAHSNPLFDAQAAM